MVFSGLRRARHPPELSNRAGLYPGILLAARRFLCDLTNLPPPSIGPPNHIASIYITAHRTTAAAHQAFLILSERTSAFYRTLASVRCASRQSGTAPSIALGKPTPRRADGAAPREKKKFSGRARIVEREEARTIRNYSHYPSGRKEKPRICAHCSLSLILLDLSRWISVLVTQDPSFDAFHAFPLPSLTLHMTVLRAGNKKN
jgi:hypothetical protein